MVYRLTSANKEMDLSSERFGLMESPAEGLSDIPMLWQRINEDGYLYLPGLLPPDLVLNVRRKVAQRLAAAGALDTSFSETEAKVGSAKAKTFGTNTGTEDNPELKELLSGGPLLHFLNRFLGGPVRPFEYFWFRIVPPGRGTRPHADIVYMGRGTKNLFTAWIPIGDVPLVQGGLIVLRGSNNKTEQIGEYLQKDVDEFCLNSAEAADILSGRLRWRWDGSISDDVRALAEQLDCAWMTADYRAGDVVLFKAQTIHASLDNRSNAYRLSVDCRYQLAEDPIDERWIGPNPIGRGVAGKRGRIC